MELFVDKGFDQVTIAEISEAADVDPTTFWRHFGSKDAIIFADQANFLSGFKESFAERPSAESLIEATIASFIEATKKMDEEIDILRADLMAKDNASGIQDAIVSFEKFARQGIAEMIAQRLRVSPTKDPRPYAISAMVVATAEWHRSVQAGNTKERAFVARNFRQLKRSLDKTIATLSK